jgi:hypothetical protein
MLLQLLLQLCGCLSCCRRYHPTYVHPHTPAADAATTAAVAVAAMQLRIPLPPSPLRIRAPSLSLALWFVSQLQLCGCVSRCRRGSLMIRRTFMFGIENAGEMSISKILQIDTNDSRIVEVHGDMILGSVTN